MQEFISLEITRGFVDQTPVIFGTVKERILEILDERFGAFHVEVLAIVRARTLSFSDFCACGAPGFFGEKGPIASRRWLAGMANAFKMSFYLEGSKVIFASSLMKDRARDWWEEVGIALGGEALEMMTWDEFVTRFRA